MTQQLSPAAQEVWRAHEQVLGDECVLTKTDMKALAAALRAAADQAHPKTHIEDIDYVHQSYVDGWKDALDVILAIADELKA